MAHPPIERNQRSCRVGTHCAACGQLQLAVHNVNRDWSCCVVLIQRAARRQPDERQAERILFHERARYSHASANELFANQAHLFAEIERQNFSG
jgi:hypothetical protein